MAQRIWTRFEVGWKRAGSLTAPLREWADVVAFALGGLAAVATAAHAADFPREADWSAGTPLLVAQLTVVVLLLLVQLGILVGARRGRRNDELEDACRAVAAFIDDECPSLPLSQVGVHIWRVSGPPFARHLRRAGSFILTGDRARSGIRWTRGKGVVGLAWQEATMVIRDLEEIRTRVVDRPGFEALPARDRLGLAWAEFERAPQYQAVCGRPLFSRERGSSDPVVEGVIAIDLLIGGHFADLSRLAHSSGFNSVIGVCEAALDA